MIYLLRHGEVDLGGKRRYVGQVDLPLSKRGTYQAQYWQQSLAASLPCEIYCSDLLRSRQTAQIIVGSREERMHILPHLREINLGTWDGLSAEEVESRFPEEYKKRGQDVADYRPPNGENFADVYARVVPLFEHIAHAHQEGNVCIIGHAGVNRVILCHILSIPLSNLFRLEQDYGSLSIIAQRKGQMRLIAMNLTPPFDAVIRYQGKNNKARECTEAFHL